MKYSPSSSNSFFRCPQGWKLQKIDKVQQIRTENYKRSIGENFHAIIKEYYSNIDVKPTPSQVNNIAMSAFSTLFDETLKMYRVEMEAMLKNFIKFEIARIPKYIKPILVEEQLEDENFKGIIDYFDGRNIIDWKTGNLLSLGDNERRQGKIYELLLEHNGYEGPFKVYFVTLINGRTLELPLTTETWLMDQCKRMFTMVKNNQFPKVPSGLCNYCDVALACAFGDYSLWDKVIL